MAAPTITSARAPETDLSQASMNEPSMEDILASIRRIIAEDQSSSLGRTGLGGLTRRIASPPSEETVAPRPEPTPEAETTEAESHTAVQAETPHQVYESAPEATAPAFSQELTGEELEAFHHAEPDYLPEAVEPTASDAHQSAALPDHAPQEFESEPLVSPAIGASVSSSFQTLAESVMLQDPDMIERIMREQMRPLLKAWLDDHLPSIVERLVRAEIERVARGGRARNT